MTTLSYEYMPNIYTAICITTKCNLRLKTYIIDKNCIYGIRFT